MLPTVQAVKTTVKDEPVITWALAATILSALTLVAFPGFPLWVHTAIVVASIITAAIAGRRKVAPTSV